MNIRTTCAFLLASLPLHAAEQGSEAPPAWEAPSSFSFVVDTPDAALQDEVLAGLHDLVCYWDEEAYRHFSEVLRYDRACAMAHWGLAMSTLQDPSRKAERDASLAALGILEEQGRLLPREKGYASVLAALLRGSATEATASAKMLAERFRGDPMARLFHILLVRDGYDDLGLPRSGQTEAIQAADALLKEHPDKHAFCFIRALLEETAPQASEAALGAARKAVELAPGHPVSHHLLGHLLFRNGRLEEAQAEFLRAAELFKARDEQYASGGKNGRTYDRSDGYLRSMLYLATTMWCRHRDADADAIMRKLLQQPYADRHSAAPGSAIRRWEIRTLPLRLMIAAHRPYDKEKLAEWDKLAGSGRAAANPLPADTFYGLLKAYAVAAGQGRANDVSRAQNSLLMASRLQQQFTQPSTGNRAREDGEISLFTRALTTAHVAAMEARSATSGQAETAWNQYADDARRAATLLLPPAMPSRSAAAPEKETPAAQPGAPSAAPASGEPRKARAVKKASKPASRKTCKGKKWHKCLFFAAFHLARIDIRHFFIIISYW